MDELILFNHLTLMSFDISIMMMLLIIFLNFEEVFSLFTRPDVQI